MTPIERAERAKQLLEDVVLREAFKAIRDQLVAKLESSPMGDVDTHHEVALSLQLLRRINVELERFADAIAVDKAREKHENWLDRMRQSVAQLR